MPRHREVCTLPFTAEQLFDVVANIEAYPSFLPWCVGARIRKRLPDRVIADLWIGYKFFRECFTSDVTFSSKERIDVKYSDGPFKYLENHWIFTQLPDNAGCEIDFYVDFEFKSRLLQNLIELLFTEAVHKMVAAFEARAYALYKPHEPFVSR